jgi:hypothetical protein
MMKNIYKILFLGACMVPGLLIAQKPVVTVKKAKSAIVIDGAGTDAAWAAAPKIAIDKPYAGETVVGGSATFQMLYDVENLYVFVDVTDDVVTLDNSADWKGDKVEIYFGLPSYVPGTGAGDEHARQFVGNASQAWFDDPAKLTHQNWYDVANWPGVASRATDGVTFGYVETLTGYSYEFKFNISCLENVDFATIDSLAFDFTLADNDVVGDGLGVRNRLVYYNTGDLKYAGENWGAMDLATLVFDKTTAVRTDKVSDKLAYISYDMLKFKGYDKAISLEVYSILGQKVIAEKNVNEVNVSNLVKGIYIISVNGGKEVYKVMR